MTIVLSRPPGILRRLWWWMQGWRQVIVWVGDSQVEEHYYMRNSRAVIRIDMKVIYPWGAT